MAARRKLIVVSNRGPVSFGARRGREPCGAPRRRRAGDRAAQPGRAPRRHLDRERDDATRTGRSPTRPAATRSRSMRATARRSGCGSSRTTGGLRLVLQRRREPDALVPAALPLGARLHAVDRPAFQHAWDEGYVAGEPRVRRARCSRSSSSSPTRPSSSTTTTSTSRRGSCATRAPDALLAHFVHIPWPQTDYWHVLPGPRSGARSTTGCSRTTSSASTPDRWRRNFLRAASDLARRRVRLRRRASLAIGGAASLVTAHPISVDPSEFDELARQRARCSPPSGELVARRRSCSILRVDRTDPSKNIVRGFRAFEFYLDAHPEMHGRVGMLALLDPSRQDIPEYAEYLGAIQREARRSTTASSRTAGFRSTCDRGQLPALGRRLQAVRRALRERDLRRAEPDREGGAARERARRRADPLRERGRARGARPVGAVREPVRPRGAGGGDPPRARR